MTRRPWLSLVLVALLAPLARAEGDAKATAQAFLDKGASLYDARDADGLVATYREDAQILWFEKDNATGEIKEYVKRGRGEVGDLYRGLFKDAVEKTTSRNVVDSARLVAPDLIVVTGTFQPDTAKPDRYPFVQTRVRQGETWLVKTLQIFVIAQAD